jgi:transposase
VAGNVDASLALIDAVDREITAIERQLRRLGGEHPYVPLLMTIPGVAWILGYTIAAEIGEIDRFSAPKKLVGYTGLCPKVIQSGAQDRRGPLAKNGPKYLRWASIEAATHACRHDPYRDLYQQTKQRLGRNRGAKIATITVARKLAEASWWMLSKGEPFAPRGATQVLAA